MEADLPSTGHELTRHSLSRATFHEICAGAAGSRTVVELFDAEHSRRRLLLRALVDVATCSGDLADPEPAWRVLADAERQAPEVVRELILYPPFGVWLHRMVASTKDRGLLDDIGYLNTVAGAAAIRADVPCDLTLPVWHGVIVLPTVGRLKLSTSFPTSVARLQHSTSETRVTALHGRVSMTVDTATATDLFRPAPAHSTTANSRTLSVWIDDTDPYREFREPAPPHETSPSKLLEWRKLLDEAWHLLASHHPVWAEELGAGVRVLTPATAGGFSSAGAVGSIAVTPGLSASAMAEAFVHEFQHSKLNAMSRLVPLTTDDARDHYYAPWRPDPRPLPGMLHGIFAFASGAEFWLATESSAERNDRVTEFQISYYHRQLDFALASLAGAAKLTDHGRELVAAVRHRMTACSSAPVDADIRAITDRMVIDNHALWRLRNVQPDPAGIQALVDDWHRGRPAGPLRPGTFRDRPNPAACRVDRQELLRVRVVDPGRYAATLRTADSATDPAFRADMAYTQDDHTTALGSYLSARDRIGDAVVGIGLCLRATAHRAAARPMLTRPEIVTAVCARLGHDIDPIAVATWLAPATGTVRVGAP